MDATLEKSCFEEISHTVLDSQQKISVRSISNNYGLNFMDAVKILQQWIDRNNAKANLLKEFIVRGIDTKRGGPFITVATEKRLKKIQDKADQVSSVLYAVEIASESSRSLNIPEEQEFKVINLPLKSEKRDVKIFTPAEPAVASNVKQEPKSKINSMFGASVAKPSHQTPKAVPGPIKEEKQSPPVKQETTKVSPPQKSPTKGSPTKKKDAKKPVSGKASIASFFSNKPSTAKAAPSTPESSAELKKEKMSPQEEQPAKTEKIMNGKHEDTPRWKRMISDESDGDDVVPNTPQETKEPKKRGAKKPLASKKGSVAKGNPSKRSRILQVEDSSEEEEEEDRNMREPEEEKTIKFDTDDEEDVQMVEEVEEQKHLSPEKPVENDSNSLNRKGRAKVKKLVTRNHLDDEGYMATVKEYVMVSEDELENDNANNNQPEEKKVSADNQKESTDSSKSKSDSKAADKKQSKVTPPAAKTKQGSIMSFFTKK
ncbi:neurofilament medium polypeptide-like [Armigeres subalbatus]|uniref:neurofilament medium polypeptide-like n=1 Tax=Armigeres subalbatus TaxID=124917 RepID=UPI002ED07D47